MEGDKEGWREMKKYLKKRALWMLRKMQKITSNF
jgi:hypothetical protein